MTSDTRKTAEAAADVETHEFEYAGVTWQVTSLDDRPWEYVPIWNRGEWDKAIQILLGAKQYKKFRETVKTNKQMNGWFEAYNEVMGGNS